MQPERQQDRTPQAYLRTIRNRKQVVWLAMFLVSTTAFVVSASRPAVYESSAKVLLSTDPLSSPLDAQSQATSNSAVRSIKTQAELAHTPVVAKRVLTAVPIRGL